MVRVAVGSTNKAKIDAVRKVFSDYYPVVDILSLGVSSSVPSQPVNNETFRGAQHRAEQLRQMDKEASYDYYVGYCAQSLPSSMRMAFPSPSAISPLLCNCTISSIG